MILSCNDNTWLILTSFFYMLFKISWLIHGKIFRHKTEKFYIKLLLKWLKLKNSPLTSQVTNQVKYLRKGYFGIMCDLIVSLIITYGYLDETYLFTILTFKKKKKIYNVISPSIRRFFLLSPMDNVASCILISYE